MTPEEHRLMMELFKRQKHLYVVLIECLRSRAIVDSGDLEAYDQLISSDEKRLFALERHVEEEYRSVAKILGVTDLPTDEGY